MSLDCLSSEGAKDRKFGLLETYAPMFVEIGAPRAKTAIHESSATKFGATGMAGGLVRRGGAKPLRSSGCLLDWGLDRPHPPELTPMRTQ